MRQVGRVHATTSASCSRGASHLTLIRSNACPAARFRQLLRFARIRGVLPLREVVSITCVTLPRLLPRLLLACLLPLQANAAGNDPVQAAADQAVALIRQGDRAGCRAAVDRVAEQALRAWTSASPAWLRAQTECPPPEYQALDQEVTPQRLVDRFNPLIALADSAPSPDEQTTALAMRLRLLLWQGLELRDGAALAEAMERSVLAPLIERLRRQPDDTPARAALSEWVRGHYGNLTRQLRMQQWLRVLAAELGEGHPLHLRLTAALAFSYRLVGRPQPALETAERLHALVQRHQAGDARLRIAAASEYGLALAGAGRLAEAMEQLQVWQDFESREQPPRHVNLLHLHSTLAAMAFELGDDDAAVRHAGEALRYARLTGDERHVTDALSAELTGAQARLRRGDADAPGALRDVIDRISPVGLGVGSAAFALSRHAERVGDPGLLAWSHDVMRRHAAFRWDPLHAERPLLPLVSARLHPPASAERQHQLLQATAIGLAGRSGSLEAQAWFALADERATAQPEQAIWLYKRGANVLQRLRQGVAVDDPGAQRLWLADHEAPLRRLVALLIGRGRLVEAQQALRVLRDEELHEYQRRSRGARRSGRAAPVVLTPSERALEVALQPLAARVRAELPAADARADAQLTHSRRMQRRDDLVQSALDEVAAGLGDLLARPPLATRSPSPGPQPDAAAALPAGSARVLYFVREAALDIAVQRGRRWQRVSVPVTRSELSRQVHALRVAAATGHGDVQAPARALYRWLLRPVQPLLKGSARLHLVPDGVLRLLPYAALHDGQRWAGERWALLLDEAAPAAGGAPMLRQGRSASRVLALGRARGDAEHAPLPAVEDELATLAAAGSGVQTAADGGFTARTLAAGLAGQPDVVHLASHFVLDAAQEEGAYLLLGDGERLPLSRLRALPWQGVHLAVLSACDTGVPDPTADGRQAGGLAAALQQAGAANVLATLWPVSDGSTAQWMRGFYAPWRGRAASRERTLPSADWVARTQRAWLRRHAGTPLAHPHHWAAFVWMAGR